jgi:hypothetical protein
MSPPAIVVVMQLYDGIGDVGAEKGVKGGKSHFPSVDVVPQLCLPHARLGPG